MVRIVSRSLVAAALAAFFVLPAPAQAARTAPYQKAEARQISFRQCLKDNQAAVTAFREAIRAAARVREEALRAATVRYRADVVSALRQLQSSLKNGADPEGEKAAQRRYQAAVKAAREALSLAPKRARDAYQAAVKAAEDTKRKNVKDCG